MKELDWHIKPIGQCGWYTMGFDRVDGPTVGA